MLSKKKEDIFRNEKNTYESQNVQFFAQKSHKRCDLL